MTFKSQIDKEMRERLKEDLKPKTSNSKKIKEDTYNKSIRNIISIAKSEGYNQAKAEYENQIKLLTKGQENLIKENKELVDNILLKSNLVSELKAEYENKINSQETKLGSQTSKGSRTNSSPDNIYSIKDANLIVQNVRAELLQDVLKEAKKRDLLDYVGGTYEFNDPKRTFGGWIKELQKELDKGEQK